MRQRIFKRDCSGSSSVNSESLIMTSILIAEDESRIAAFIEKGLRKNGFDTAIVELISKIYQKSEPEIE